MEHAMADLLTSHSLALKHEKIHTGFFHTEFISLQAPVG